jgi:hypothetical protein
MQPEFAYKGTCNKAKQYKNGQYVCTSMCHASYPNEKSPIVGAFRS